MQEGEEQVMNAWRFLDSEADQRGFPEAKLTPARQRFIVDNQYFVACIRVSIILANVGAMIYTTQIVRLDGTDSSRSSPSARASPLTKQQDWYS